MYIPNPLDAFDTYSVHYVMLACRTTVVAQQFASDDDKAMLASLAAVDATRALGDTVVLNGNANDIFLMLDTRRFSQFSVETLKYDVLINGLQKGAGGTSNLAVDLSMTILDSTGISFAEFMQWLLDKQMKCNYDGLIFMLRTIFVGHHPDGTSETVQSETIPMHLNKMEINLDFAKGAYNLEFMPNMNFDVNRYNRWLTVSLATTYHTGKGNKLGGIITNLEKELNRKSAEYFNSVQDTLKKIGSKPLGRLVQYMITLPNGSGSQNWEDFEVLGATPGGSSELKFTPEAAPASKDSKTATTTATPTSTSASGQIKDSATAVKPSMSIPKVIDAIFKQVPKIAKLGNFQTNTNNTEGVVTFYKYIVGITSDDFMTMVHVDVVEFKVPNVFAQTEAKTKESKAATVSALENEFFHTIQLENGLQKREPRNFLEYDYIHTGKNKDILHFDMKIQDFQYLLSSNIRIGDDVIRGATGDGNTNATPQTTAKQSELLYTRQYDPIIMPLDTEAAMKNFANVTLHLKAPQEAADIKADIQRYTKNLSMFYGGSVVQTAMTIKGNPLIMHKFNMGKLLQHPTSGSPGGSGPSATPAGSSDRVAYRKNLENEILRSNPDLSKTASGFVLTRALDERSYATSPVYVKVNVLGPNVNFKTGEQLEGSPYATSVLSDNFYVIMHLTNIITNGVFTQELELHSYNIFGSTKIEKDYNGPNAGTVQKA